MFHVGFAALVLCGCKSDPPSDQVVNVGGALANGDSGVDAASTGATGGSMATTGGMSGGSTGNTGGAGGSDIFPDLDASTSGTGGKGTAGGTGGTGNGDAGLGSGSDGSLPMGPNDAAECFDGGVAAAFEGSGTGDCGDPLRLDLSAGDPGDVSYVVLPTSQLDTNLPVPDKCGAGTARDLVLLVWVPLGADLDVTVDGEAGADPTILAVNPATADCGTATVSQCVDQGGKGACEYIKIHAPATADPGYRQIVVSEVKATETPYTLRLRLQWSGTGA